MGQGPDGRSWRPPAGGGQTDPPFRGTETCQPLGLVLVASGLWENPLLLWGATSVSLSVPTAPGSKCRAHPGPQWPPLIWGAQESSGPQQGCHRSSGSPAPSSSLSPSHADTGWHCWHVHLQGTVGLRLPHGVPSAPSPGPQPAWHTGGVSSTLVFRPTTQGLEGDSAPHLRGPGPSVKALAKC